MTAHDAAPGDEPWMNDVNAPLEAETGLIGAALADQTGGAAKILFTVPTEDFAIPHAANCALAMQAAMNGHPSPDVAEVASVLRERGEASSIKFLAETIGGGAVAENAALYAKRIRFFAQRRREDAARRRLAEAATPAAQDKAKADLDDVLEADSDGGAPWSELLPLDRFERPPFPFEALSPVFREWSTGMAAAFQVPVDLPAMLCLSVTAAASARKFTVQIRPGWVEPLNIYEVTALPPGGRKSAVYARATAPVYDYEERRREAEAKDRLRAEADFKAAEKRLAVANDRRAQAKTGADRNEAQNEFEAALKHLDETPKPAAAFRMIGDDITPEAVVKMMAEQDQRFAIFSAEGGLLRTLAGSRYSKTSAPSFDALLKAHAGDPIAHDRKGSDPIAVRNPALTLGLCVQPQVLRDLANEPGARGVGLLARFAYSVPEDRTGAREIRAAPLPPDVDAVYRAGVTRLLEMPMPAEPVVLPFNIYADDLLAAFEAELEPRLGVDGDLRNVVDWASKLAGLVARIAAGLALSEHPGETPDFVEERHVEAAIQIGRYLLSHARLALLTATKNEDVVTAERILAWCDRRGIASFTPRDALKALRGGDASVQNIGQIHPAISLLIETAHIRRADRVRNRKAGRPPKDQFEVRPAADR